MKNVTQIPCSGTQNPSEQSDAVTLCQGPHSVFSLHRFLSRRMFTDQRVWFRMIALSWYQVTVCPGFPFSIVTIMLHEDKAVSLASFFLISRDDVKYRRSKINN